MIHEEEAVLLLVTMILVKLLRIMIPVMLLIIMMRLMALLMIVENTGEFTADNNGTVIC